MTNAVLCKIAPTGRQTMGPISRGDTTGPPNVAPGCAAIRIDFALRRDAGMIVSIRAGRLN